MRDKIVLGILVAGCMAACSSTSPKPPPSSSDRCATRTGGALITFQVGAEAIALWITNDAFIDEAKAQAGSGKARVALFERVIDGQDCDDNWTFHVDPARVQWADNTIELCDGRPSDVERDTPRWIADVKSYCPWKSTVASVDDRRPASAAACTPPNQSVACNGQIHCVPAGSKCCGFGICGPSQQCMACAGRLLCVAPGSTCCGADGKICTPGQRCLACAGRTICAPNGSTCCGPSGLICAPGQRCAAQNGTFVCR